MPDSSGKLKVVVLGGGIASLSAACELTGKSERRNPIGSVTVYQMGWRLGGKGASGRNAGHGHRIEEHGLHIWPGFYENAFDLMRQCYEEMGRSPDTPLAAWDDAFQRQDFIVVEELLGGDWKPWGFTAPRNGALPGDGIRLPTLWDEVLEGLKMMLGWYRELIGASTESVVGDAAPISLPGTGWLDSAWEALQRGLELLNLSQWADGIRERRLSRISQSLIGGLVGVDDNTLFGVALRIAGTLHSDISERVGRNYDLIMWFVDRALDRIDARLGEITSLSDTFRRLRIQLDFGAAVLRGVIHDRLMEKGLDSIDDEKFADWLGRHGASTATLESGLVRGFHDFVFAQEKADPTKPNLAAGVALRLILRLTFTYKGAIMWKMRGGMGDVVFAPLWQVLRQRGVEFKFFHRVKELTLASDGKSIAEIKLARQATLKSGPYEPLIDVNGLPCWPDRPLFEQLVEGPQVEAKGVNLESIWADWADVEEVTLKAGIDFDVIVLGIPLGAIPHVCGKLVEANSDWKNMVENIATVQTQAAQLWFVRGLDELGWPLDSPILTAFAEPLETWADMSQTLSRENWPDSPPKNVAYFCATLPDAASIPSSGKSTFPTDQGRAIHDATIAALGSGIKALFPDACQPGSAELNWDLLHDPSGGTGKQRFEAQYWRANVEPSERYVQSTAGSTRYRLPPGRSGFGNLFLAGDWTRNGLNVGCIEAAVISGRRAARDLLGDGRAILGELDT